MNHLSQNHSQPVASEPFDPYQDPFTSRLISQKVNQLLRKKFFTRSDAEDLTQELLFEVIKGLDKFNAALGHRYPYIKAIVERKVVDILRTHGREKRDAGDLGSLNVSIEGRDVGHVELAQTVNQSDCDRRTGRERRLSAEQVSDLRQDLASVIADLPEQWQTMLELLKKHKLTKVSMLMGVPRSRLTIWLTEIRLRCQERGIENYFEI